MSISVLAKGLVREYQIDYETAKMIYQQRAKRRFDRPGAFRKEKILSGGNGSGNRSEIKRRAISR